ncbi:MAG: radical SAM protein, partial [Candidatus Margulisbacteria bacterium]|nr:radical SAM protein [Candidatus Margulisiibacteriota bacterium]
AVLKQNGHEVKILDGQITSDIKAGLEKILQENDFDVVGFSCVTQTALGTIELSRLVKHLKPGLHTIVGGVHPTVMGKTVLDQMPDIDIAVIGEGERTILELADNLQAKRDLDSVDGLVFRRSGELVQTKPRALIKDLDSIPFPEYGLIDIEKYTPPPGLFFRKPIAGLITARGCFYNCNFCADRVIWQGQCRLRSAGSIIQEIELLTKKFGVRELKFFDSTFTINRQRTRDICEALIEKKLDVIWRCSSRVDTIDLELLKLMKKSGCLSISFGIESGDEAILKKMNKRITIAKVKQAVKWANEAGMEVKGFFLLNYPGDTVESTEKTIKLSRELDLDFAGFNLIFPSHGTRVRDEIIENYEINQKAWDNLDTPIGNEMYFYQKQLPVEYLMAAYERAVKGFYFRPKTMIRALKRIRNFDMLKSYIQGFFRLLGIKARNRN